MNELKNTGKLSSNVANDSASQWRENLLEKMLCAIRQHGVHSSEVETLRLQYRNLDSSIRLGLL